MSARSVMEDAEIMTDTPDDAKQRQIDAMYQKARRSFPDVTEITAEELQELKARENVVLVDVRSDQEQAISMIPGAVTSAYFEEHQPDYRGAAVAVYCTVGQRSGNYAKTLQADGWRVFNLKGAILAWTHGGGALENADGPTRKVHVCNRHCDLVADGYEAIW